MCWAWCCRISPVPSTPPSPCTWKRYARERGYQILLCCGRPGDDRIDDLFAFLVSQRVDGILLVSASSAAQELLPQPGPGHPLRAAGGCAAGRPPAAGSIAVSTDNYVGGATAAAYLHRLGHRQVLYLGPRRDSVTHALRLQGFLDTAAAWQMEAQVVYNDLGAASSAANGYRLARQMLAGDFPQTAVFAPSDAMALGVLQRRTSWACPSPAASLCWDTTNRICPPCPRSASAPWPSPPAPGPERRAAPAGSWWRRDAPPSYTLKLITPRLVERSSCRSFLPAGA